jgi:hypothetical protein
MRRAKSLRIGVHHANAVVWGPVYRTHLREGGGQEEGAVVHGVERHARRRRAAREAAERPREAAERRERARRRARDDRRRRARPRVRAPGWRGRTRISQSSL